MVSPGKRLAAYAVTAFGISLVAIAIAVVGERPVTGAIILPALSTIVVNTSANPVPTTAIGTTTVTGVVALSGTPTVTVGSGTVSVSNSPAGALRVQEVRPVDPIAGTPFYGTARGEPCEGTANVPAGKILILEHVFANTTVPVGLPAAVLVSGFPTPGLDQDQDMGLFPATQYAPSEWAVNQDVRLYLYPGPVTWSADGFGRCSVTGRLVDAPQ